MAVIHIFRVGKSIRYRSTVWVLIFAGIVLLWMHGDNDLTMQPP